MSSIQPETARMWADRLVQYVQEIEHELMTLAVSDPDLDAVVDRLDALAHDIRAAAEQ